MPSPTVQGTLSVPGQVLQLGVGNTGVGQPGDSTCVISLTGTFSNAVIGVEAVPIGQPVNQPLQAGPFFPPTAQGASEWVPIGEVGVLNGQLVSSPLTLSSAGGLGTGFAFSFGCGIFQLIQLRLISIGSGAIQGGIATLPFPVAVGVTQQVSGSVLVTGDYLQQLFALMQRLTEPLGMNLQPITLQLATRPDMNALNNPS